MEKQMNSSTEHSRSVPQLRFPEFNGEWERKPLIELSENGFSNGAFNDPRKVGSGYRIINVKDMYVDGTINVDILTRVAIDENEFSKNRVEYGDIFFTRSSLVKEGIAHSNVNLSNADDLTFDGHLIRMRPKKGFNSSVFLYYNFSTENSRIQFIQRGKTTTMTTIGQEDIATVEISFPTLPEQTKIASFLTAVDEKLQALKKKKSLLADYKKGIMQKLFTLSELGFVGLEDDKIENNRINNNDENENPTILKSKKSKFRQLRFKDENGKEFADWEVKKLGEVGIFFSGGTPLTSKRQYFNGNIPFIRSGEINSSTTEQFISQEGLKNSSSKIVEVGDLLYALYGATSGEVGISKIKGAINQAILCIRTNLDNRFLHNYLLMEKENIIKTYLQGGQGNLSADIIKSLQIPIPSLPEQTLIANFLSSIDQKINHTQMQITQTEQWKKGLLQKMFV